MQLNGSELSAFYYTNLNKNTVGLAGLSLDYNSDGLVYIPYVRLNYTFDNGFRLQGRYKWKLWDYGMVGADGNSYHSKIQEFDSFIGYKYDRWDFLYQFDIFGKWIPMRYLFITIANGIISITLGSCILLIRTGALLLKLETLKRIVIPVSDKHAIV